MPSDVIVFTTFAFSAVWKVSFSLFPSADDYIIDFFDMENND